MRAGVNIVRKSGMVETYGGAGVASILGDMFSMTRVGAGDATTATDCCGAGRVTVGAGVGVSVGDGVSVGVGKGVAVGVFVAKGNSEARISGEPVSINNRGAPPMAQGGATQSVAGKVRR